jgi:glyoxylase I family protein
MLRIRHLDHLVLRVTDLRTMMAFYTDVLGCPVEKVQEDLGLYQLRAGSGLIDLVPVDGKLGRMGGAAPAAEGRNLDHFCLRVEPFDAEAIIAHLRAHGADPAPVASRYGAEGQGPSIYVSDPEGTVVELKAVEGRAASVGRAPLIRSGASARWSPVPAGRQCRVRWDAFDQSARFTPLRADPGKPCRYSRRVEGN